MTWVLRGVAGEVVEVVRRLLRWDGGHDGVVYGETVAPEFADRG